MDDFPLMIEEPVYYCGFNSPKSYGGNSYFVRHPHGNWLVDSPKFLPRLVSRFESMGGVSFIFLTHRDDVADADRFAEYFQCRRIIHRDELASQPGATPGHTKGHGVLLLDNRFLFTGDHLDWDREGNQLSASKDYCWYSWPRQIESMKRLANFHFEWVLPGHGQRVRLDADEMREQMVILVKSMRRTN